MPLPPPPTEVPPVAPSFPIIIGEETDVRADVSAVIQGPETQKKRAAKMLTGIATFTLSYLAKTPLGQAGKPRDLAEKAIEGVKGGIEKIKGAKEGVQEGIETIKELGQWIEKSFSTNPPVPALLAWASSCLLMGTLLDNRISKKEGKVAKAVLLILLTRLGIAAIEQWGSEEALWGIAGGTAAVTTGLAIWRRDWWTKWREAFRTGGETLSEKMRAAWKFFDKDIMPRPTAPLSSRANATPPCHPERSVSAVEGSTPTRPAHPAERSAPPPECNACGGHDLERGFCCTCGSDNNQPATPLSSQALPPLSSRAPLLSSRAPAEGSTLTPQAERTSAPPKRPGDEFTD